MEEQYLCRDYFGALPKLVWHEDEPIAHPSSVPLYFVSALAKQFVTVVLTGYTSENASLVLPATNPTSSRTILRAGASGAGSTGA